MASTQQRPYLPFCNANHQPRHCTQSACCPREPTCCTLSPPSVRLKPFRTFLSLLPHRKLCDLPTQSIFSLKLDFRCRNCVPSSDLLVLNANNPTPSSATRLLTLDFPSVAAHHRDPASGSRLPQSDFRVWSHQHPRPESTALVYTGRPSPCQHRFPTKRARPVQPRFYTKHTRHITTVPAHCCLCISTIKSPCPDTSSSCIYFAYRGNPPVPTSPTVEDLPAPRVHVAQLHQPLPPVCPYVNRTSSCALIPFMLGPPRQLPPTRLLSLSPCLCRHCRDLLALRPASFA